MSFSDCLLRWFEQHGRKDLPWQQDPTPYRVWVSEIMLQQTQVTTVIPYFQRFVARFPEVWLLAAASLDEVLHVWAGLGYYARARNLHQAAHTICARHAGEFPKRIEQLRELPGIGRSTAGAILALACQQRHPILDGNVKRVLARYQALAGWPGASAVERELWEVAEQFTPLRRVAEYTQAIMDLGATVCTRSKPACTQCPVQAGCVARALGRQAEFPTPRPRTDLPVRRTTWLLLVNPHDEILLQRRPPVGIWGGLWSLPECPPEQAVPDWCHERLGCQPEALRYWAELRHTFSHFRLIITPVYARIKSIEFKVLEPNETLWYNTVSTQPLGFPAPVRRLLTRLNTTQE